MNGLFRPFVCLSVRPSHIFHYVPIIVYSGFITNDRCHVHAEGQGQRLKVKVTYVMTPLSRFRTATPVWIHIWQWSDACSLTLLIRGALLFFKVIRQISRSNGQKKSPISAKIGRFRTVTPVWIYQWLWNDAHSLKQQTRCALLVFKIIRQISRSHGAKRCRFWRELSVSGL